jgi:hypothetical protein
MSCKKRKATASSSETGPPKRPDYQQPSSPANTRSRASTPVGRESVVWDIERGLDLGDSDASDRHSLLKAHASTVMMDTRATDWFVAPEARTQSPDVTQSAGDYDEPTPPVNKVGPRGSPSTLAPWHSASQCGISIPLPPTRTFVQHPSNHSIAESHVSPAHKLPVPRDVPCHPVGSDSVVESMPIYQQVMSSVSLPLSTRLASPTHTADSLEIELRSYEAEDQSVLHMLPGLHFSAWRPAPGFDSDMFSCTSEGRAGSPPYFDYQGSVLECPSDDQQRPLTSSLGSPTKLLQCMNVPNPVLPPYSTSTSENDFVPAQLAYESSLSQGYDDMYIMPEYPDVLADNAEYLDRTYPGSRSPELIPEYIEEDDMLGTSVISDEGYDAYPAPAVVEPPDRVDPQDTTDLSLFEDTTPSRLVLPPLQYVEHTPSRSFSQGQHLLQACAHAGPPPGGSYTSEAEMNVVADFQHHWYPVRR